LKRQPGRAKAPAAPRRTPRKVGAQDLAARGKAGTKNPNVTPWPTHPIRASNCRHHGKHLFFNSLLGTRNPVGGTFSVVSTTDVSEAKVVHVTWSCSRTIMGARVNTESVQTAQIVIRKQG